VRSDPTKAPIDTDVTLSLSLLDDPERLPIEWDDLVGQMAHPSPFLRRWWLSSVPQGTPAIVLIRRGGRLIGGAAFETDHVGPEAVGITRVRCLGQGSLAPDHLDVVSRPADTDEVTGAVIAWLRGSGARIIDLDGLAADGSLARALRPFITERTSAPWASLSDGADAYLSDRPGTLRSTVSRTTKRLIKAGATIGAVDATGEDDAARTRARRALADLHRLHDQRWAAESGFLDAWPRFHAAAMVGLASGDVVISQVVASDGTVVATELDLRCGDVVAFYQAGRSTDREWRGAGSALRADIIGRCAAAGATEYDMLRGDESYKADWATGSRELVRVRFGVGTSGRALHRAAVAWRRCAPRVQQARQLAHSRLSRP
jgi:hypothetical protein